MGEGQAINCTVLMAGAYLFRKGKRISIRKEGDLFYASSEGKDFGLVKEIHGADEIPIPEAFEGIVTENQCEQRLLKARVKLHKNHSFPSL